MKSAVFPDPDLAGEVAEVAGPAGPAGTASMAEIVGSWRYGIELGKFMENLWENLWEISPENILKYGQKWENMAKNWENI